MKFLKSVFSLVLLLFIFSNTTQCRSAKKEGESKKMMIEKVAKIHTKQAYFEKWAALKENGGSGINIYFPGLINKNNYTLKQVYFRGMIGEIHSGKASYFANLKQQSYELIMTNKENGEYGNTLPNNPKDFPFKLADNECIISYLDNDIMKYVKIDKITEKKVERIPNAPRIRNKE